MIGRRSAVAILLLAAACKSGGAPVARGPAIAGWVGDSLAFLARVEKVDYHRDLASIRLGRSAYLTLLSVDQIGRIEQIAPADTDGLPSLVHAGLTQVYVTPPSMVPRASGVLPRNVHVPAYKRAAVIECIPRHTKQSSSRRVRRVLPNGTVVYDDVEVPGVSDEQAAAICVNQLAAMAPNHPRPTGFLLVLASSVPIAGTDLSDRLRRLSFTADDASSRMTAIAEGVFAGRGASWSGHFVHW